MDLYFTNLRFLLFAWRWLILISTAEESSSHGGGGGDGDLVKLVSLMSLVELLISSKDLSFVIQLTTTMKKSSTVKLISSVSNGCVIMLAQAIN